MKTIIAVLGGLLSIAALPRIAAADCGCAAELITASVAEGRPTLVATLYCANAKTPPGFVIEDATGTQTAVTLAAVHPGYLRTVQYALVPDATLAPGAYELVVSKAYPAARHPFTVVAAASSPPLEWATDPSVGDQRQTEFGCGPAKGVEIEVGATTATLALVELTDAKTHKQASGYVRIADDKLSIGHGMCGGEFPLVSGRAYTAAVSLLSPVTGAASAAASVAFTYKPKRR